MCRQRAGEMYKGQFIYGRIPEEGLWRMSNILEDRMERMWSRAEH